MLPADVTANTLLTFWGQLSCCITGYVSCCHCSTHCSVLTPHLTAVSAAGDLWALTDSPVCPAPAAAPAPPPESEDRACAVRTSGQSGCGHRTLATATHQPREIPSEIATITKHQFKFYYYHPHLNWQSCLIQLWDQQREIPRKLNTHDVALMTQLDWKIPAAFNQIMMCSLSGTCHWMSDNNMSLNWFLKTFDFWSEYGFLEQT